jgi:hypothetical protein
VLIFYAVSGRFLIAVSGSTLLLFSLSGLGCLAQLLFDRRLGKRRVKTEKEVEKLGEGGNGCSKEEKRKTNKFN